MSARIDLEEFNTHMKEMKNDIKEIKDELITEAKKSRKKGTIESNKQKLNQLNAEYENIAQLCLDQSHAIQNQWQSYQEDTKPSRKKEIEKRQKEFENDLELLQVESRTFVDKQATCRRLIDALKTQDRIHVLNQTDSQATIDTSIVIIPNDILELFWAVEVENIPTVKSDIPSMILHLENMLMQS